MIIAMLTSVCRRELGSLSNIRFKTTSTGRSLSALVTMGETSQSSAPQLARVPKIPVFGSMLPLHSGIPKLNHKNWPKFWCDMHEKYGSFIEMGIPNLGTGLNGTLYVLTDAQEMQKILHVEQVTGTRHAMGIIESQWPIVEWLKKNRDMSNIVGFYGRDEEWWRLRSFLQKDLLAPQAAREYTPALIEGAQRASQEAPLDGHKFNRYLNCCALDMFGMVLLGDRRMDTTPQEHKAFCNAAVEGLGEVLKIKRDPLQTLANKVGIETMRVKQCHDNLDIVREVAMRRIKGFIQRMERGELNPQEQASYLAKAIERQRQQTDVSFDEMVSLCVLLLLASVDTTAGKLSWNLLQLALHPSIQQRLYEQLDQAIQKEGGELTPTVLDKSSSPLLHAIVRETHRVTPAAFISLIKDVSGGPVEVHGETLPAGSIFVFNSYTPGMDPMLVDNPQEYRPERWFKEAVAARKGTPDERLDHPFFAAPFSQGSRRCPGSRVASLEVHTLVAQIILDYKLVVPEGLKWQDITSQLHTVLVPDWPELRLEPRR